jgi:Ca2+-binding RTX toxin-like protein
VLVVDTLNSGTSLDTVLALYAGGPGIEALGLRWCSDDAGASVTGSRVLLRPEPRTTYYIQAGGFGSGTLRLDYRFYACTIVGKPDLAETLVGTSGNDVVCGNGINEFVKDTVLGLGGDDVVVGGRAEGGPGDDFIWANQVSYVHAAGGVVVDLRNFNGHSEGRDVIYAADIYGSPFADRLSGDGFQNHIFGRNGDDVLVGHGSAGPAADDALYGGKGDDVCDGEPC